MLRPMRALITQYTHSAVYQRNVEESQSQTEMHLSLLINTYPIVEQYLQVYLLVFLRNVIWSFYL